MRNKLSNLDNVDRIRDTNRNNGTLKLRYELIRDCASVIPDYWMRGMQPSLTFQGAVAADARVRESFERVVQAADTPDTDDGRADSLQRRRLAVDEAFLAANKGGWGLHEHQRRRVAAWVITNLHIV